MEQLALSEILGVYYMHFDLKVSCGYFSKNNF